MKTIWTLEPGKVIDMEEKQSNWRDGILAAIRLLGEGEVEGDWSFSAQGESRLSVSRVFHRKCDCKRGGGGRSSGGEMGERGSSSGQR
jgi:hypothetical protein